MDEDADKISPLVVCPDAAVLTWANHPHHTLPKATRLPLGGYQMELQTSHPVHTEIEKKENF